MLEVKKGNLGKFEECFLVGSCRFDSLLEARETAIKEKEEFVSLIRLTITKNSFGRLCRDEEIISKIPTSIL